MSRHSSRPLKCVCHLLCMLKCAPCSSCLLNQFDSYSSFTFWILLLLSKIIKEYQNSNGGGDSLRLKTILLGDHKALLYTKMSECLWTYRPLVIILLTAISKGSCYKKKYIKPKILLKPKILCKCCQKMWDLKWIEEV